MKRLLILLMCLTGTFHAAAQCSDEDTVRSNSVSMITATTARVNGTTTHFGGFVTSLALRYVRVGHTDTTTATQVGTSALRNLTGLTASTTYYYYYVTTCGSSTIRQNGPYYFATSTNNVLYVPERPTVFQYLKTDTGGVAFLPSDTLKWRTPSDLAIIKYKASDNTFYGYYPNCTCWHALATDSAGIVAALDLKVDSVTVAGDSLFWWNDHGVSHGYILPALANVWKLDGNTNGVLRSIGTLDAYALPFIVNNVGSGGIYFGNTGLGYNTMNALTSGHNLTSIGYTALRDITSGAGNTAIGIASMKVLTTGNSNVGLGENTLQATTTGSSNTANGISALYSNTTGGTNTAVGSNALYSSTTTSGNVGLGYFAGKYNTLADRFFLNNQDRSTEANDSIKSLVYGVFNATAASQRFKINGRLEVIDGTQGAGKVLTSDASGAGTWATPTSPTTVAWALAGNASTVGVDFLGTTNNVSLPIRLNNIEIARLDSSGARLNLKAGLNPLLSLKQKTSNQEWQLRVGVNTGTSNNAFNIYDATNSKIRQYWSADQTAIGDVTSIPSETMLYLRGNSLRAATFDARGDSTSGFDFSAIEAEKSDYTNGEGVAIEVFGNVGISGSTNGWALKNLSRLRMRNTINLIEVQGAHRMYFGTYDTVRMSIDSIGGKVRMFNYGSGLRTGTATYGLSVDASGNIIESASAPGGSGTLNYIPKFTPNGTTLGNSSVSDNGTIIAVTEHVSISPVSTSATSLKVNAPTSFSGNIFDAQVNAASKFAIDQTGNATIPSTSYFSGGQLYYNNNHINVSSGNSITIGTDAAGTITFFTNGVNRWNYSTAGHFLASTDNTYDIGSATFAPRTVYANTSVISPVGTFATSVTSPLLIGGTGTTSPLTYKTTTGVGTTGADHIFLVGNNGATEAMRIINGAQVLIGASTSNGAGNLLQVYNAITYGTSSQGRLTSSGSDAYIDGAAGKLFFRTNGATQAMVIDASQNVGIGTTSPTSLLHTAGSFATAYIAKTANYTATISDQFIDCTSGTFQVTLPTAVGITGRIYTIKNSGAGTITIGTTSSQTVDGVTTKTLNVQYTGFNITSDGANWKITGAF